MTLLDDLRRYASTEAKTLPPPAGGSTPERHRALYELARGDLTLARLAEAHTDALAMLAEAGRSPHAPDDVYAVWAAEKPSLRLDRQDGGWTIDGTKAFCTGAGLVDRALITVPTPEGSMLFDIDVRSSPQIVFDASGWVTDAFDETCTATAELTAVRADADALVGEPNWYIDRPGFWHGAIGPASCWAGGAAGLVDAAEEWAARRPGDLITQAHIGALVALRWRMEQVLFGAGVEIDALPGDRAQAHRRALICRHEIDVAAGEIVDRFGRLLGPRPLAFDRATVRRISEVELYRRQCHAEYDLAQLGRSVLDQ